MIYMYISTFTRSNAVFSISFVSPVTSSSHSTSAQNGTNSKTRASFMHSPHDAQARPTLVSPPKSPTARCRDGSAPPPRAAGT